MAAGILLQNVTERIVIKSEFNRKMLYNNEFK